jgi:hypothetical protein
MKQIPKQLKQLANRFFPKNELEIRGGVGDLGRTFLNGEEKIKFNDRYFGESPVWSEFIDPNHKYYKADRKPVAYLEQNDSERYLIDNFDAHSVNNMILFYLLAKDNKFYVFNKDEANGKSFLIKHTTFSRGEPVKMAGHLQFDKDGKIVTLGSTSGHYGNFNKSNLFLAAIKLYNKSLLSQNCKFSYKDINKPNSEDPEEQSLWHDSKDVFFSRASIIDNINKWFFKLQDHNYYILNTLEKIDFKNSNTLNQVKKQIWRQFNFIEDVMTFLDKYDGLNNYDKEFIRRYMCDLGASKDRLIQDIELVLARKSQFHQPIVPIANPVSLSLDHTNINYHEGNNGSVKEYARLEYKNGQPITEGDDIMNRTIAVRKRPLEYQNGQPAVEVDDIMNKTVAAKRRVFMQ